MDGELSAVENSGNVFLCKGSVLRDRTHGPFGRLSAGHLLTIFMGSDIQSMNDGPSGHDGWTVRTTAEAHWQVRRWRLRPWFGMGFVSKGSWECREFILVAKTHMH